MKEPTAFHLFCGSGGGGLGFRRAGFRGVGAVDSSAAACRDYAALVGEPAAQGDLSAMSPADIRAVSPESPDVVFTSPPCKGFSGCLPQARAATPHYMALNSLAYRGIWLALEAWERKPRLILMENVPRIQSRGREWLAQIVGLLQAYGYAVAQTTHDCGVLGGLAQRRKRFLLVARHLDQVESFLRVPSDKRVRGIGEVLGQLPVPLPGVKSSGPMHTLPRLSAMNWLRLALIPPGKDWRAIPESVSLPSRGGRPNGPFGVEPWASPSHAVLGYTSSRDTWGSVADPRIAAITGRQAGTLGIESWEGASHTVTGQHGRRGWDSIADPRLTTDRYPNALGVRSGEQPALTIRGTGRVQTEAISVADPRLAHVEHLGCRGVQDWTAVGKTVRASHNVNNAPASVADPRMGCEPRGGTMGVEDWAQPSHAIRAHHHIGNSPASVADPRIPELVGEPLDLDTKRPLHLIIRAADGSWHRPLTTLELAALQGFPTAVNGKPLVLDGKAHRGWRERIGNAVPPPTAEAIARSCAATLLAAAQGNWSLDSNPIWVSEQLRRAAARLHDLPRK